MVKKPVFSGCLLCLIMFFPALLPAEDFIIYDSTAGSLPAEQPWLNYFALGTVIQQPIANGVKLTTGANAQAGYSNHTILTQVSKNADFPVLDRNKGFALLFELQVHSETHLTDDRAGFSVILLAGDNKGAEIGFWENEIWAQTDTPELFTHGEGIDFDTTGSQKQYTLSFKGDNYALYQDGVLLLTGRVKDYSTISGNPLFNPYRLSNFLFLGDDTTSAEAVVTLGQIVLRTNFPWPIFLPAITNIKKL